MGQAIRFLLSIPSAMGSHGSAYSIGLRGIESHGRPIMAHWIHMN